MERTGLARLQSRLAYSFRLNYQPQSASHRIPLTERRVCDTHDKSKEEGHNVFADCALHSTIAVLHGYARENLRITAPTPATPVNSNDRLEGSGVGAGLMVAVPIDAPVRLGTP